MSLAITEMTSLRWRHWDAAHVLLNYRRICAIFLCAFAAAVVITMVPSERSSLPSSLETRWHSVIQWWDRQSDCSSTGITSVVCKCNWKPGGAPGGNVEGDSYVTLMNRARRGAHSVHGAHMKACQQSTGGKINTNVKRNPSVVAIYPFHRSFPRHPNYANKIKWIISNQSATKAPSQWVHAGIRQSPLTRPRNEMIYWFIHTLQANKQPPPAANLAAK